MSIVAGIDFGTLSARVSLFSSREGRLSAGVAEYPLLRSTRGPNYAMQSQAAQMRAMGQAVRSARKAGGVQASRRTRISR